MKSNISLGKQYLRPNIIIDTNFRPGQNIVFARVEATLTLRPDQVLYYAFRSQFVLKTERNRSSLCVYILEEYGLAMLNRDIKLIFWIVPVICIIFSPTKGKFIRLSLTKVYIFISSYFFLLKVFYTKYLSLK